MTIEWRELGRERVADCRIFRVERSLAVSPHDGTTQSFYCLDAPDWAQIMPITKAGEVVFVRQYRHGIGRVTLEVPGGLMDPGEDPAAAALRECFEETGYRAARAVPFGVLSPNPAVFNNRLHLFLAPDAELAGEIQNTSAEHTEVVLAPLRDLKRMIEDGTIEHALVTGMIWQYLYLYGPR